MLELGNIVSDFIGVNLLIGSIPLTVCIIIDDPVIRVFTAIAIPLSFLVYVSSEYTIEARRYRPWVRVPFAITFAITLAVASLNSNNNLYYLSFVPIILTALITTHSMKYLQYKDI